MLIFGSRLISTPVMSLQTGTRVASATTPVIDPGNLKVFAYEVDGPLVSEKPSYLRTADIRETGSVGIIIDSSDEFVSPNDIIKLQELLDFHFSLVGIPVIDEQRHKLGKVEDYTLETGDFFVQQLKVKRGIIRGITDTGLLVHRSQIVEVNDKYIVVKSTAKKVKPAPSTPVVLDYVNPFREQSPQPEPISKRS